MLVRSLAGFVLLLAVGIQVQAANADRQFINVQRDTAQARPPFSDAVLVGNTLYIAGHLGVDPKTGRAPEDPQTEAKLAMDQLNQAVEASGLAMDDFVSMQVFCTDLSLDDTFNNVYRTYFTKGFPARAFIGAPTLLRGAHFEVLGIAVRHAKG